MTQRDSKMEHQYRQLIYNFILHNPGSSFGVIQRMFNMNGSTLKYHLRYLERSKKVLSRKEGKRRCYFCADATRPQIELVPGMDSDSLSKTQMAVLLQVRKYPGSTQRELSRLTKLNQKSTSYTLNRLIEMKLIWKVKEQGQLRYEPITKERLKDEMMKALMLKLLNNEIDQKMFMMAKKRLEELMTDQ